MQQSARQASSPATPTPTVSSLVAIPERYVAFTGFASLQVGSTVLLLVVVMAVPGDGRMVLMLRPSAVWV